MGEKKKHVALWSTGVIAAILLGSAALSAGPRQPVLAATTTEQTDTAWTAAAERLEDTALLQNAVVPVTWQTPVIQQNGSTLTVDTQTTLLSLVKNAQSSTALAQAWQQIGQQIGWRLAMTMTHVSADQLAANSTTVLAYDASPVTSLFNSQGDPDYTAILTQASAKCMGIVLAPALQALQTTAAQQGWANLGIISDNFAVTSQPLSSLVATASSPADLNNRVQRVLQQLTQRMALQVTDGLQPQTLPDGAAAQLAAFLKEPAQSSGQTIGAALTAAIAKAQFTVGQPVPEYGQVFAAWQTLLTANKPEQGADGDKHDADSSKDDSDPTLTVTPGDDNHATGSTDADSAATPLGPTTPAPNKNKGGAVLTVQPDDHQTTAQTAPTVKAVKDDRKVVVLNERITSIQYDNYNSAVSGQDTLPQTGEAVNQDDWISLTGFLLLGLVLIAAKNPRRRID